MTRRLIEIQKLNTTLSSHLESDTTSDHQIKDAYAALFNAIASYLLSDKNAVMKISKKKKVIRTSRKLKSLESILKSKEGEVTFVF